MVFINKFTIGIALIAIAYYFGYKTSSSPSSTLSAELVNKSVGSSHDESYESMMLIGWQQQIKKPARKIKRVAMG